jgi:NAD(P)-dependent dehydrogenase (short-subunit alcohol dehydrogenase family)
VRSMLSRYPPGGADVVWKEDASSLGIDPVHCDVADASSVQACVDRIEVRNGGVDILVNNAALAAEISPRPFEQITPEEWTRVLTVNTLSQFLCSKAVVPLAPGLTVTEGIRRNKTYSEEMLAGVIASRAIAREERPEDLVGTCLFLASEAAGFITGQIVVVDGGATFH